MQDKRQYNAEGQPHGLWESYSSNGKLWFKGLYRNGLPHGPWEEYWSNGKLFYKCNYKKGEYIGYFQWYNSDGSINNTKFYAR